MNSMLRLAPLAAGAGLLAFAAHFFARYLPYQETPEMVRAGFFFVSDLAFWGAIFWGASHAFGKNEAAKQSFLIAAAAIAVGFLTVHVLPATRPFAWIFGLLKTGSLAFFVQKAWPNSEKNWSWQIAGMFFLAAYASTHAAFGAQSVGRFVEMLGHEIDLHRWIEIRISRGESSYTVINLIELLMQIFLAVGLFGLVATWLGRVSEGRRPLAPREVDLDAATENGTATLLFYGYRFSMYCLACSSVGILMQFASPGISAEQKMGWPRAILSFAAMTAAVFFVGWALRKFLIEHFSARGQRSGAQVWWLNVPILAEILWPILGLATVEKMQSMEKRVAAFMRFQDETKLTGLKITILLLHLLLIFWAASQNGSDTLLAPTISFCLAALFLFVPQTMPLLVGSVLLLVGLAIWGVVESPATARHDVGGSIIRSFLMLGYAWSCFGVFHAHWMGAEPGAAFPESRQVDPYDVLAADA